jgi:hypothetical protein
MGGVTDSQQCALWYQWGGRPIEFELADSEEAAARRAVSIDDCDWPCDLLGVQFADGRIIEAENWPAFDEARRREDERYRQINEARPPDTTPKRAVADPFDGQTVMIDASAPSWVGRPTTTS